MARGGTKDPGCFLILALLDLLLDLQMIPLRDASNCVLGFRTFLLMGLKWTNWILAKSPKDNTLGSF